MMKKTFFLTLVACVATLTACQPTTRTDSVSGDSPASQPHSEQISGLRVAYDLAMYAYSTESPSALIVAADILTSIPQEALNIPAQHGTGSENETVKSSQHIFTAEGLLTAAQQMAQDDELILAMADRVRQRLSSPTLAARGATGGTKHDEDVVRAHTWVYYDVQFDGQSLAECFVAGDGDTDLDLYIYDQNGFLVVSDTDYTDHCYVSWRPERTATFRIKIVNRGGVYNRYSLITN